MGDYACLVAYIIRSSQTSSVQESLFERHNFTFLRSNILIYVQRFGQTKSWVALVRLLVCSNAGFVRDYQWICVGGYKGTEQKYQKA